MADEADELIEEAKSLAWNEFCNECHNTEEQACVYCEYNGKGAPSEFQTFQDAMDYLNLND